MTPDEKRKLARAVLAAGDLENRVAELEAENARLRDALQALCDEADEATDSGLHRAPRLGRRWVMGHMIREALERGGLGEEEAYFVLRFAGRVGYKEAIQRLRGATVDGRALWKRLRRSIVWVGGWEAPELLQWDAGLPAWRFEHDPWPVTVFGRATFYGRSAHGYWGQVELSRNYLVWGTGPKTWMYLSPNGTPSHPEARDIIGNRVSRDRAHP